MVDYKVYVLNDITEEEKHLNDSDFIKLVLEKGRVWPIDIFNRLVHLNTIKLNSNFRILKDTVRYADNIKTVNIIAKCGDKCNNTLVGATKEYNYEGILNFVPNQFNDYLNLSIDLNTGRILNWIRPSQNDIKNIIENEE